MSKATKILDLDKFGDDAGRTITIGGIEYPVVEMSFANFVETTKEAQKLQANPEATVVDHVTATVAMIQRSVPTIPTEVLEAQSIQRLGLIVQFLQGELDQELEKTAEAAAEAGAEEAKK